MGPVRIPEYIDALPQILAWETDEMAPAILLMIIGYATGTLTWCLLLAIAMHNVVVRYKENHMRGYLFHKFLYRSGIIPLNRKFTNGAITFYHS